MLGKKVKILLNGNLSQGNHNVEWNGINNSGIAVGNGIYICRMTIKSNTELYSQNIKMTLLK